MPHRTFGTTWIAGLAVALTSGLACVQSTSDPVDSRDAGAPTETASAAVPIRIENAPHLPNAFRLSDRIISGGLPEGDPAFAELAELGVKTVISVDGMKPDVETARNHGLRYVHLPIGYDDVPAEAGLRIARAIRDLPGPVYVHCHHGRHRSPAAAAVASVILHERSPEQAVVAMKTCGTSDHYPGLYQAASFARPASDAQLDMISDEFPAVAVVPPFVEAMTAMDHHWERLKASRKNLWQPPRTSPDVIPISEAILLGELCRELGRTSIDDRPADFKQWMHATDVAAHELANAIEAINRGDDPTALKRANAAADRIGQLCTDCHTPYRNAAPR
jgi:protein tyrosine phosphatase (PTP) superfamily phosphohydrolase (DUF442 family)